MPTKLADVKELMLDKISACPFHRTSYSICCSYCTEDNMVNRIIDKQGQKQIGLNREKLAHLIYSIRIGVNVSPTRWEEIGGDYKDQYYKFADSIIAQESELLEVKE